MAFQFSGLNNQLLIYYGQDTNMAICKYGKYKDGGVLTRKPKRCQEICVENVRIDVPRPHTCQYVFCLGMKRELVQSDTYLLPFFLNKTLKMFGTM